MDISSEGRGGVVALECGVQHYAWGDTRFLPALLGVENRENRPYAELWMGAHRDLPSKVVVGDGTVPLDRWIADGAAEVLGPGVAVEFDRQLPYLFKILCAGAPLSIQTHPEKQKAEAGFVRENAGGVPLSAPNRNYKDPNHKPELIAALTDFYGLRGFRPPGEIAQVLRDVPELGGLMPDLEPTADCSKAPYERFMTLPQEEVDAILEPVVRRLAAAEATRPFDRADREYWVLRADREFSGGGHRDRGLFSIFLLNLIHLKPGEAMYLPAGVLHAYLEGSGVEIMANSNNVLRGGLTPKHVDVGELLDNVRFEGRKPKILRGEPIPGTGEWAYKTPAREFELRRIEVTTDEPHAVGPDHGAEILIVVALEDDEPVQVASGRKIVEVPRGGVVLAPHGVAYTIRTAAAATLYKATVPGPP